MFPLYKRLCLTCDPWDVAIFSHTGIILTNLNEVHYVMLYTIYQRSRSCVFRQDDFFMFSLYKPVLNM